MTSLPAGRAGTLALPSGGATCNRRDDRERVSSRDRGSFLCGQVAHVLVVEIEIHKSTKLSFACEKVLLKRGVRARECVERVGDGGRIYFHRCVAFGIGAQRRWDKDRH